MRGSKQSYDLDVFVKLPDELIIAILKKLQTPKTLIRCSVVCKHLQSLVSKLDTVFLRFSYPGEAGNYLPCWKSHYHIPQSAIPALIKVFANVKSFKIKLCLCPALLPGDEHAFKLKAVDINNKMRTCLCTTFEVGSLSCTRGKADHDFDDAMLSIKRNSINIDNVKISSLLLSFFLVILRYRPKTLSSVVILSAEMQRTGSKEVMFVGYEQLTKLRTNLVSNTRSVKESWLKVLQNLVYWLKKHEQQSDGCWVGDQKLWLVQKWEGERCNVSKSTVEESDVKELVDAFQEVIVSEED